MKRRVAKKVLGNVERYRRPQITKACKRLGKLVMGIDLAADGTKDATVTGIYNMDAATTGRVSSFHHRTGQAPKTPGAIPPTPVVSYDDMTLTDLKDAAKAKGMKGYSTMKKAELVALLKGE